METASYINDFHSTAVILLLVISSGQSIFLLYYRVARKMFYSYSDVNGNRMYALIHHIKFVEQLRTRYKLTISAITLAGK